ncbi:MAG TPA: ABC transporter substrate-binding protein [Acetobacteraceae bacterium]|jgi:branched-chain amino acid transport system substrate-binding protein|nr:ABC transporter substrate-binding protein [Acetobacteraceae bacterium]
MAMTRRAALGAGIATLGAPALPRAQGRGGGPVRIGVLNDQNGSFKDLSGTDSLHAVRMAVEDFGGTVLGRPVEVLGADHQNKVDVGVGIARRWFDEGVQLVLDVPNSAICLGVQQLAREKGRVAIFTSGGTSDLTGRACSPNGVHWTYDTYALAAGVASGVLREGGKSWFFLTSDYAFGHALQRDAARIVQAGGGRVAGEVKHPLNTADFSGFLLQARGSRAQVIGLANGSADTVNTIKQAREFGIVQGGQRLAALLFFITDVHSLGLEQAQGIYLVEAFYWDQTPETRAWSRRFAERARRPPTMLHATNYEATMHYLAAIRDAGTDEAMPVVERMRATPINSFMTSGARIREDGRVMRDMYLYKVKAPDASRYPWDYYELAATIPAEQAFRPLAEGGCPMVRS